VLIFVSLRPNFCASGAGGASGEGGASGKNM
jgi:hypothetical protein